MSKYAAKCDKCGRVHVKHSNLHRLCRGCEAKRLIKNNKGK